MADRGSRPRGARVLGALVALGACAVLVGCTGASGGSGGSASAAGTGLAHLPAAAILAQARAAALAAGSVRVSGVRGGVELDLQVGKNAATGTVTSDGLTAHLLRVGGRTYVKGDKVFWDTTAGTGAGDVLAGKWVVAGSSLPATSGMAAFTDLGRMLDLVLTPEGAVTIVGESVVDGQRVVGLRESASGAVLYVAAEGPPYPVTIRTPGEAGLPPTFSGWGKPVVVRAPADTEVVDPTKLGG